MSDVPDLVATQAALAQDQQYRAKYLESNRDEVLRTGVIKYPSGVTEPLTQLERQRLESPPGVAGQVGRVVSGIANLATGNWRPAANVGIDAFNAAVPALNAGSSVWQAASDPANLALKAMEDERKYRQQFAVDNWRDLLLSPKPTIKYPNGAEEPLTEAERSGIETARAVEVYRAIQQNPARAISGTVTVDLPQKKQKLEKMPDGSIRPVVDMQIPLRPAERLVAAKTYAAQQAKKGKGEGLYWAKRLPFGAAFDAMQFADFYRAAERIAADDKDGTSTATDTDYLTIARLQQEAENRGKQSFWGKAWDNLTAVPGYIGEFMLTSGAVNPVASTVGKKAAMEAMKRTGQKQLSKMAGAAVGTVVAEGGLRTVLRPQAVAAEAAKAMAPDIGVSEGRISSTPGDSAPVAIARGFGLTAAENISERTGEGFAAIGGKLLKRLGFGQKTVQASIGPAQEKTFRDYIRSQAVWSGVPAEFAEEYAADVLSAPIIKDKDRPGNPTFMLLRGDWKGLAEDFAQKAAVLIPTGAVMNHAGLAVPLPQDAAPQSGGPPGRPGPQPQAGQPPLPPGVGPGPTVSPQPPVAGPPGLPGPAGSPPPTPNPVATPQGGGPTAPPDPNFNPPESSAEYWQQYLRDDFSSLNVTSPPEAITALANSAAAIDPDAAFALLSTGRTSLAKIREAFPDFPELSGSTEAKAVREAFVRALSDIMGRQDALNDIRTRLRLPAWTPPQASPAAPPAAPASPQATSTPPAPQAPQTPAQAPPAAQAPAPVPSPQTPAPSSPAPSPPSLPPPQSPTSSAATPQPAAPPPAPVAPPAATRPTPPARPAPLPPGLPAPPMRPGLPAPTPRPQLPPAATVPVAPPATAAATPPPQETTDAPEENVQGQPQGPLTSPGMAPAAGGPADAAGPPDKKGMAGVAKTQPQPTSIPGALPGMTVDVESLESRDRLRKHIEDAVGQLDRFNPKWAAKHVEVLEQLDRAIRDDRDVVSDDQIMDEIDKYVDLPPMDGVVLRRDAEQARLRLIREFAKRSIARHSKDIGPLITELLSVPLDSADAFADLQERLLQLDEFFVDPKAYRAALREAYDFKELADVVEESLAYETVRVTGGLQAWDAIKDSLRKQDQESQRAAEEAEARKEEEAEAAREEAERRESQAPSPAPAPVSQPSQSTPAPAPSVPPAESPPPTSEKKPARQTISPSEPIPPFVRTTPTAGSEERKHVEEMRRVHLERENEKAARRRAVQKEFDKTRRNAHKKRRALQDQINELTKLESEAAILYRDYDRQLQIMRIEDALENPPSLAHFYAGMAEIEQVKANDYAFKADMDESRTSRSSLAKMNRDRAAEHRAKSDEYASKVIDSIQGMVENIAPDLNASEVQSTVEEAYRSFGVFSRRPLDEVVKAEAAKRRDNRTSNVDNDVAKLTHLTAERRGEIAKELRSDIAKGGKDWWDRKEKILDEAKKENESAANVAADEKAAADAKAAEEKAAAERTELADMRKQAHIFGKETAMWAGIRERAKAIKPDGSTMVKLTKDGEPVEGEIIDDNWALVEQVKWGDNGKKEETAYYLADRNGNGSVAYTSSLNARSAYVLLKELGLDGAYSKNAEDGMITRAAKAIRAFENDDMERFDPADAERLLNNVGVTPTTVQADIVLDSYDLGVHTKKHPRLAKLHGRGIDIVKQMADAVPEFSYDPVFVSDGTYLVFRDGQKFTLSPTVFNLHHSEVPKGTRVGINLDDLGIHRNTPEDVIAAVMEEHNLKVTAGTKASGGVLRVKAMPSDVVIDGQGTSWVARDGDPASREKVQKLLDKIRWNQPDPDSKWPSPNRERGPDVGRYVGEVTGTSVPELPAIDEPTKPLPSRPWNMPAPEATAEPATPSAPAAPAAPAATESKPKRTRKKKGPMKEDASEEQGIRLPHRNAVRLPLEMDDSATKGETYHPTQIVSQLKADFGLAVDRGRVPMAGAEGTYNTRTEAIRIQKGREGALGVIAHEVAHHVDKLHQVTGARGSLPAAVEAELPTLDYAPQKHTKKLQRMEGFAEFVRYWSIDDPTTLSQRAPATAAWWDGWLKSHPETAAKLNRYREMVQAYIDAGPTARRTAARAGNASAQFPLGLNQSPVGPNTPPKLTKETLAAWMKKRWLWWLSRWEDKNIAGKAFDNAVRAHGGDYDPTAGAMSVHDAMLSAATAGVRGLQMTQGPLVSPNGKRVLHPGLDTVVQESGLHPDSQEYADWAWYYQARMMLEVQRNFPDYTAGIDREDARDIVNRVERAANMPVSQVNTADPKMTPELARRIVQLSDDVTAWFNALANWSKDMHVITPGAYAAMMNMWGHVYAPQWRQDANDDQSAMFMPTKFVSAKKPFQRLSRRGSQLPYVDPLQVAIAKAGAVSLAASHRAAELSLLDAISGKSAVERLGSLAQTVVPTMEMVETALDNLLNSLHNDAKALQWTPSIIRGVNRIRMGQRNMTKKLADAIAQEFNVTIDWSDQQSIDDFYDIISDPTGPAAAVPDITSRVSFWRPVLESSPQERIVAIRDRSGKVKLVQMEPFLYEAFTQRFDSPIPNLFLRAIMSYAWGQRTGAITASPSFLVTNPGRDIWGIMAGAPVGDSSIKGYGTRLLRQPASLAKAIINATFPNLAKKMIAKVSSPETAERMIGNALWRSYERSGLTTGNPVTSSESGLSEGQQKLFGMGYGLRILSDLRNGRVMALARDTFDSLTGWAAASDSMGRYVAYVDALREMGYTLNNQDQIEHTDSAGNTTVLADVPEAVSRTAAIRARETGPDFFRSGRWRNVTGPLVGTFFWASVAGAAHLRRTVALAAFDPRPEVRKAMQQRLAVAMVTQGLAAAAWWLMFHDKDWYQELKKRGSDELRRKNFFFGGDNGVQYTFPKGYQWGVVSNAVIDALDAMEAASSGSGVQALRADLANATVDAMMELLSPTGGPPEQFLSGIPAIGPMIDIVRNKQWDQRRPIVPRDLEDKSPALQVRPDTSELAKAVAAVGGTSPIQTEYFLNQASGGALRRFGKTAEALQQGEYGEALRRSTLSGYIPSFDPNQSVNDVYDTLAALKQKSTDATFLKKPMSKEDTYRLRELEAATDLIGAFRRSMRSITSRDNRRSYDHWAVGTARAALGDKPLAMYPDALRKGAEIPEDIVPKRDEIVAKFVRYLTIDRPSSVTKLEKAKGISLADKIAEWSQDREHALQWLKSHDYEQDDATRLYFKMASGMGHKTETIGRNLTEIRRLWK